VFITAEEERVLAEASRLVQASRDGQALDLVPLTAAVEALEAAEAAWLDRYELKMRAAQIDRDEALIAEGWTPPWATAERARP
jgi:hypothetical protein